MIFKNIKKILVIIIMFLAIRESQAQDFSIEARLWFIIKRVIFSLLKEM